METNRSLCKLLALTLRVFKVKKRIFLSVCTPVLSTTYKSIDIALFYLYQLEASIKYSCVSNNQEFSERNLCYATSPKVIHRVAMTLSRRSAGVTSRHVIPCGTT